MSRLISFKQTDLKFDLQLVGCCVVDVVVAAAAVVAVVAVVAVLNN